VGGVKSIQIGSKGALFLYGLMTSLSIIFNKINYIGKKLPSGMESNANPGV
jgi:hypothetical protein